METIEHERAAMRTFHLVGRVGDELRPTATVFENNLGDCNTPAEAIRDFVATREREIARLKADLARAERHVAEAKKLTAADFVVEKYGF